MQWHGINQIIESPEYLLSFLQFLFFPPSPAPQNQSILIIISNALILKTVISVTEWFWTQMYTMWPPWKVVWKEKQLYTLLKMLVASSKHDEGAGNETWILYACVCLFVCALLQVNTWQIHTINRLVIKLGCYMPVSIIFVCVCCVKYILGKYCEST